MCGILCLFGEDRAVPVGLLTHRGPDDYRTKKLGRCRMDFYRLAINDLTVAGMQPFFKGKAMYVCNGEIYDHARYVSGYEKSKSDCEVLGHLISHMGIKHTAEDINGDFAIVYSDGDRVLAARDYVGVRPLFYTRYAPGSIAFASEVKALTFLGTRVEIFPPGHFYDSYLDFFVCYHTGHWPHLSKSLSTSCDVRHALEQSVHVRLNNTERDVGFLLSGGLDSSLIASIAQRKLGKINTFSIGLDGSPDLDAARKVAKFLGSNHHEVVFTVEQGLAVLEDVIHSIESYDCTTVRASVPMWILCKYIKEKTSCRYIFSGEGSDEILGGYIYFKNAPTREHFSLETMRRLHLIHQFDGLRADRCAGAHGLDLIVPFLDKYFVSTCMQVCAKDKMKGKIEKNILREAFVGYLPEEILWRTKDGMSDAVGSRWVEALRAHAKDFSVDDTIAHNTPLTGEEMLYRKIFRQRFHPMNDHLISEIWRPKWTTVTDPSARLLID